jgi:hypothetical protein
MLFIVTLETNGTPEATYQFLLSSKLEFICIKINHKSYYILPSIIFSLSQGVIVSTMMI